MEYYPILFAPIHKQLIWGTESWDISCRPGEMSIIENGVHKGLTFAQYIEQDKSSVLGTRLALCEKFPLLIKIIEANQALSVQVHPTDEYAMQTGQHDSGKSELWYIMTPPTDGHLIVGLKPGVTKQMLRNACENGTVEDCLNRLRVKEGDIVNIPAGLIHALTPGVKVAEIQQNSDLTYRLYDYNRVDAQGQPRPLHIEDALAVTNFGAEKRIHHFAVEKYILKDTVTETQSPDVFSIFTCVKGSAAIKSHHHETILPTGRSAFIPAQMGEYVISGQATLLKSFVPGVF